MDEETIILDVLKSLECDENLIEEALRFKEKDQWYKLFLLLRKQRCVLMDKLHQKQQAVDKIDYLIFLIKKKVEKEKNNE